MLSGPILPPPSGTAKQLIVFLHGYGSDGHDLIGLAPYFQARMPDALCMAPHGPHPTDMGFGYQWFGLRGWQPGDPWPDKAWDEVVSHGKMINHWIDAQLEKHGLGAHALAMVGFSQGTMMSLHAGLRREAAAAAIVGFSGALLWPQRLETEITARPHVLLAHGDADAIVPFHEMAAAEKSLSGLGVPVRSLACPGLAHSIDNQGLTTAVQFVAERF
jgi:phospholipase/carboxylesterase